MKKIMKKTLFGVFATLALTLTFGANLKQEAVVNAQDITPETTLYLRPGANWREEGAKFAAYFYVDDFTNDWQWMTQVDGTDADPIFKVTSGATRNYPNVIFVRMDPAGALGWDGDWNQTADLTYTAPNNLFFIEDNANAGSPGGTWKEYLGEAKTATTEGINSNKVRIWLNRQGNYANTEYEFLLHVGETYLAPTGYEKVYADETYFAYYDVDQTAVTFTEVGLTVVDKLNVKHLDIPAQMFNEGDNSKLWFVNYDEGTSTWSYSKGAVGGRVLNSFVAKVLEGYLSCSPRLSNGYLAFDLVNTNFKPEPTPGTWDVEGDLGDVTIDDFASEADYATGTRTVTIDAYTKYVMLQTNYEAANGGGALALNNVTRSNPLIISLFFISVVGLSLVIFVSNRKKNFAK